MPAAIPAIAAVGGALIGGAASKSAANTQAKATDRATQAEREMFERQVEMQEPWRQAGGLGLNKLSYLLGVSPTGTFTPGSTAAGQSGQGAGATSAESEEAIRARLAPQFVHLSDLPQNYYLGPGGEADSGLGLAASTPTTQSTLDQIGLDAAVKAELAKQQQAVTQQQTATNALATSNASKDPAYGSLLRNFGMQDFQQDPGYGFRMSEGQKALDRASAASGRFNSGRAAKDLTRFGQNLASEEYGNAYNRFNTNQSNTFNRLASLAGIGQTATNQVSNAAGNLGSSMASNIIGAGNAAAAGRIGTANSIGNGLGQLGSMYQQNQLMGMLNQPGGSYGGFGMSGGGGFGTGAAFGNQDYGSYI